MMSSIATMGVAENAINAWDRALSARSTNLNDLETEMFSSSHRLKRWTISQRGKRKKGKGTFRPPASRLNANQTQTKLTSSKRSQQCVDQLKQGFAKLLGSSPKRTGIDSTNEAIEGLLAVRQSEFVR